MGFIRILLAFAFGEIRLRLDRVPCDVELYLVAHALFPFAALIVLTPEMFFGQKGIRRARDKTFQHPSHIRHSSR